MDQIVALTDVNLALTDVNLALKDVNLALIDVNLALVPPLAEIVGAHMVGLSIGGRLGSSRQ